MSSRATSAFRLAPRGASTSMGSLIMSWGTCPGVWECVQERDGGGAGAKTGSLPPRLFCPILPVFFSPFFLPRAPAAALCCSVAQLSLSGIPGNGEDQACTGRSWLRLLSLIAWVDPAQGSRMTPAIWSVLRWSARPWFSPNMCQRSWPSAAAWLVGAGPIPSNKEPLFVWCNPSPTSTRLDFGSTGHSQQHHQARPAQQLKCQTFFLHSSKNALRPRLPSCESEDRELKTAPHSEAVPHMQPPCGRFPRFLPTTHSHWYHSSPLLAITPSRLHPNPGRRRPCEIML